MILLGLVIVCVVILLIYLKKKTKKRASVKRDRCQGRILSKRNNEILKTDEAGKKPDEDEKITDRDGEIQESRAT